MLAGKKPRLPLQYQEVEFLYSDGSPFIQTALKLTQEHAVKIKFTLSIIDAQFGIFGSRSSAISNNFSASYNANERNRLFVDFGTYSITRVNLYNSEQNTPYIIIVDKNKREICADDGTVIARNTTPFNESFETPSEALLFRTYGGFTTNILVGKVYYYEVYSKGILIAQLIPCYRKSDNKPGMYDLVNNQFYTNAGTGEFIVGPNV